jgi:hypothetical protein
MQGHKFNIDAFEAQDLGVIGSVPTTFGFKNGVASVGPKLLSSSDGLAMRTMKLRASSSDVERSEPCSFSVAPGGRRPKLLSLERLQPHPIEILSMPLMRS